MTVGILGEPALFDFGVQLMVRLHVEQFQCSFYLLLCLSEANCHSETSSRLIFLFHQFFAFMHSYILLLSVYIFLMVRYTLWPMVRTHSGKGVYDDVPESSNRRCRVLRPPVPPSAPPVGLDQLLAPLNAIVQRLVAIVVR
jgi:hypothetical protein